MNGINSLLNESKLDFKRGQKIRYWDRFGNVKKGTYALASSAEGYVVLDTGKGQPHVCPIKSIIN